MANLIEILIEAKDSASAKLAQVEGRMNQFSASTTAAAGKVNGLSGALEAFGTSGPLIAVTAVTAAMGAMAASVEHVTKLGDLAQQLENLSAKSGVGASDLEALQKQMTTLGIPTEALGTALKFLQKALADGKTSFGGFTITAHDTYGALLQLADQFKKMPDGPEKTRMALEFLGSRGGSVLIPFLDQGSAAMVRFKSHIEDLGAGLTDLQINKLAALHRQQEDVKLQWEGLANTLSLSLLPQITQFTKNVADLLTKLHELSTTKMPDWLGQLGGISSDPNVKSRFGFAHSSHGGGATWDDSNPNATEVSADKMDPFSWSKWQREAQSRVNASGQQNRGFTGPQQDALQESILAAEKMFASFRSGNQPMKDLTKSMEEWAGNLQRSHEGLDRLSSVMVNGLAQSIQQTAAYVASGGATILGAFSSLIDGIIQKIAEAAISQGIGDILSMFPGGSFLNKVGGAITGHSASAVAPSTTFVIQSIDAKSALDAIIAPTGSFRNANSRLRDVAAAY